MYNILIYLFTILNEYFKNKIIHSLKYAKLRNGNKIYYEIYQELYFLYAKKYYIILLQGTT